MPHFFARPGDPLRQAAVKRFAPRLWTVDFPRPMMAALTNPAPRTIRVDLAFLARRDLAGLIWESEDRWSHRLCAYRTIRDYGGCTLAFDWVAGPGMRPLDAVHGPTLTIEGRDRNGQPKTWYVRLWNYAEGSPDNARIRLNFGALNGGFLLPSEADPVYPHDIDRLFISLMPVGYADAEGPLAAPVETWVELRNMEVTGANASIPIHDAFLPEHALRIASGFDDSYNQAPERLVEQWLALGYRGTCTHYVGMSHYPALLWDGERFVIDPARELNGPSLAWHRAFAGALKAQGFDLIWSLSYELFDSYAPSAWVQRKANGERGLTGWDPPSALLSPTHGEAMAWLGRVAARLMQIAREAGLSPWFQVGEPWWWVGPDHQPCFYDATTVAAHVADRGAPPPLISDIRGSKSPAEIAFLDWLGERLAASTAALVTAARVAAGEGFRSFLLFFSPQVLDPAAPELVRANMPAGWSWPAFDGLQLEDYDLVVAGDAHRRARGWREVGSRLGYPASQMHYFAGFVLRAEDAAQQWPRILAAASDGARRGVADVFVWAWPQVRRDGLVFHGQLEEQSMDAFHDVRFPLAIGFDATGGPEFLTEVAVLASGFERRNILWQQPLMRFDAGLGVRSEADLRTLLRFFRARQGQAFGFRFEDPLDNSSALDGSPPGPFDQRLGVGDGRTIRFPVVKTYDADVPGFPRRITRPRAEGFRVAVAGAEQTSGWILEPGGFLLFEVPPAAGAEVTCGYWFDVPVRFAVDRLDISMSGFRSGEVPSVPLIEIREDPQ
ncbi:phage distal tail protein, Rcc01695 family [Thermaurantiacus sp.]